MILIEDIQSTISAQLSAHSYLSGLAVIVDNGLQTNTIENALGDEGKGVAIVVSFPTDSQPVDGANNLAVEDFSVCVTVRVNAMRNAVTTTGNPGAQKSLLLLLSAVREAVLSWETENNDRLGFRSAGSQFAWEIDGEVGYYVNFSIRAAFQNP